MATTIIDGKQDAASVTNAVTLENEAGVKPGFAVVIVGDDPASHTYVGAKSRMSKECGFKSIQHTLPEETTQEELAALVETLNADETIHGILVQRITAPEKGEGKSPLVGDVAYDDVAKVAGVGPMTIAMLMANPVIAAYRKAGRKSPKL